MFIKKCVAYFFFSMMIFYAAFGQRLELGVTVSPTFSFVASDNDDVEADGSKIGIVYGLMADYQFSQNERYKLFTGFNIHHTGAKFASDTENYEVAATLLEIPAVFKLETNIVDQRSFYGQFGFNFGIPLSSKVKEGIDTNVQFKGLLVAVKIGGGVQFELAENGIALNTGIYFDNGFTNLFEIEGEKFRLKHLGLRLGVYF